MSQTFMQVQGAAELALASMALRSWFARERDEEPELVALRLAVSLDAASTLGVLIEVEFVDVNGIAIGGLSL